MARKGRDLEKVVGLLEQLIENNNIKITSPEYIIGKNSKSNRELDITLRKSIGSTEILVMIECRDRPSSESEGVEWLEQIATKRADVGASKAVVVSSTSFTSGAKETAKAYDIDLRSFEEVNKDDIELWFEMKQVSIFQNKFKIIFVNVHFINKTDNIQLTSSKIDLNDKFLKREDNVLLSITDVLNMNIETIYKDITSIKTQKKLHVNFDKPISVDTNNGWCEIEKLVIDIELWLEETTYPLKSIKQYKSDTGIVLGQTAEFEANILGEKVILALNKELKTGHQSVTLRKLDNK